ncbi:MAG: TipAS antibiotic-recognition domain-containing protein [Actinomycetes bacterium]
MTHEKFASEAENLWGTTVAYEQSQQRLRHYTPEDIELSKKHAQEAVDLFLEAMRGDLPPDSELARQAAELHRSVITRWWYDCSYEMQANLAGMYVADSRFAENYNSQQQGLAQYIHDAILANAIEHL